MYFYINATYIPKDNIYNLHAFDSVIPEFGIVTEQNMNYCQSRNKISPHNNLSYRMTPKQRTVQPGLNLPH